MTQHVDALIGHTGFVGGTLDRSDWPFAARFNSRNIETIRGLHFGTVVCAGVSAAKWKANQEPEADWNAIQRLIGALGDTMADRFVLISTVDVYPHPVGVTEDDRPDPEMGQAYGRHRLHLERFVAEHFPCHHIVRLPALFGDGLKKNILFDLLTGNMTAQINPNGSFQWYPLRRLKGDLQGTLASGVSLLNVSAEPVRVDEIAAQFFPDVAIGAPDLPAAAYDVHTRHAALLGGEGAYHFNRMSVMDEISAYVASVRARGGRP